jgi:hypothetical protein
MLCVVHKEAQPSPALLGIRSVRCEASALASETDCVSFHLDS